MFDFLKELSLSEGDRNFVRRLKRDIEKGEDALSQFTNPNEVLTIRRQGQEITLDEGQVRLVVEQEKRKVAKILHK